MPLKQDTRVYGIGWRGLLSLPLSLLEFDSDNPGCFVPLALLSCIPGLLLSYLKVSPDGLEVRYWPFYHIRAQWEHVDHIGKHKVLGLLPSDVLYLKHPASFGSRTVLSREVWPDVHQRVVVLNDFRGWKNGRLAENLGQYIPEIMESRNNSGSIEN